MHQTTSLSRWNACAALALLSACADVSLHALAEETRSTENPIVDGRPASAAEELGTVALAIADRDEEGNLLWELAEPVNDWIHCTGTLIGPSLVLTAAHCIEAIDELNEELLGVPVEADQIRVATPNMNRDNVTIGETALVSRVVFHPDYALSDDSFFDGFECAQEDEFGRCDRYAEAGLANAADIALLELAEALDSVPPVPPLPAGLASDALRTDAMVTLSGFGLIGLDQESEDMPPSLNVAESLVEDTTPTEILTRPVDGGDACAGDSGGPLYVNVDGTVYVAGVTSRGRLDAALECGEGGIFSAVSGYEDWLEESTDLEVARRTVDAGGGGCSLSASEPPSAPLILLVMLWGRWRLRKMKSHDGRRCTQ